MKPDIDSRLDKDARTLPDIYEECRDRLKMAQQADYKNRRAAKADILFREGDQWDTDSAVAPTASEDKPQLVINFTDAICQRIENAIREDCPRGGAHPIGDGADTDLADVIEGIGRHVELRSSAAEVAYPQAARGAINGGEGYFRLITEWEHPRSFQKELRIVPIRNAFTVFFDPSSLMPAGEDANWVIVTTKMRRAEYKLRYPRASNAEWKDDGHDRADRDWEDKAHIRLAEYFRITEVEDKAVLLTHPSGVTQTRFASEVKPEDMGDFIMTGERPAVRREVQWFRLNGKTVIERATLPGSWIPVFRVEGNRTDVDGETIKRGAIRFQRDPQKMMNVGETAQTMRLMLAPKAGWMAMEGQLDGHMDEWQDANITSYPVLIWKPVLVSTAQGEQLAPPPQPINPPQIEAGFAQLVAGMRSNLLMVAGMQNEPAQDVRGEVVSGRALQRRDKQQDKSHLQYNCNLRLAVAQCWRVMLDWIPATYREPGRMQRIIGADTKPETVALNQQTTEPGPNGEAIQRIKNDLSVGRYDVAMDAGPSYQTRREEGSQTLLELMSIGPLAELVAQHGPDLVFRSLDHPYMQELADRLQALTPEGLKQLLEQLPKQARAVVQALQGQVQQLQGQVQKLTQDLKGGITKAHIAATVKAHDVDESNKTKRADTLIRAHTEIEKAHITQQGGIAKAEVTAAGKIVDTHTQGRYDRDAAEIAADAAREAASAAPSTQ